MKHHTVNQDFFVQCSATSQVWKHSAKQCEDTWDTFPRPPTSLETGNKTPIKLKKFSIMRGFRCLLRLQLLTLQQKLRYWQSTTRIYEDRWWDISYKRQFQSL